MKWIRQFAIISLLTALTLEGFSVLASKAELLLFNDPPGYSMNPATGLNWRNEKHAWGAWHKANSTDQHVSDCFSVLYRSNDVGSRDDKDYRTLGRSDNVAVMGDSFVEGYGVELNQTFSGLLNQHYGKQGLNFGVTGAVGPVQQYLLYDELISTLPHDEVIYFFLPANDFSDNSDREMDNFDNRYRPYFTLGEPDSEGDGGATYRIKYPPGASPSETYPSGYFGGQRFNSIARLLVGYTWSANALRTINYLFRSKYIDKADDAENYGYFSDDEYSVDGALYYVDKLFARIPGSYKKTIIVIPDQRDLDRIRKIGWGYKKLPWYRHLKSTAEKYQSAFIDLALDENGDESRDYIAHGIKAWFLACDPHWNGAGNQMALSRFLNLR